MIIKKFIDIIKKNIIYIILIQVTLAILGSLYYSDIKGYEPCVLCWYQRICMYSLFPIIIIAKLRKEKKNISIHYSYINIRFNNSYISQSIIYRCY